MVWAGVGGSTSRGNNVWHQELMKLLVAYKYSDAPILYSRLQLKPQLLDYLESCH